MACRERDGKPQKFGKPDQRPRPRFALEYRQHPNSRTALGVVPLDVPLDESTAGVPGLYKLVLRAGPRGDRLLDLHAAHIPADAVAYAPFPGFVVCGARDAATHKRKLWMFMASSSQVADVERAQRWYKGLVKLKSREDAQSAGKEEQAQRALAAQEQAQNDGRPSAEAAAYVDDDFEEGSDDFEEGSDDFEEDSDSSSGDSAAAREAEAQKRAAAPTFHLSVTVTECRNLPSKERFGKNDPYVSCRVLDTAHSAPAVENGRVEYDDRRARRRTTTCEEGGASPVWSSGNGETLSWDLKTPGAQLIVEVWEEDDVGDDDLIGKLDIPLDPSGEFEPPLEQQWYALQPPPGAKKAGAGEVRLSLRCWREAGAAKGVGWARVRQTRTRVKVAAHVNISTAPAQRDREQAERLAKGAAVKQELQEAMASWEEAQREIDRAIARGRAAAGIKVDPMGKEAGHPSFYQPPPRTLYTAQGYAKDARNKSQGAEIFEGGSGVATGRHVRYTNGELRLLLDAQLEQQLLAKAAKLWNSKAAASSRSTVIRDKRLARINRGLLRIPDPYPEDE